MSLVPSDLLATMHLGELLDLFDPDLPIEQAKSIPGSWYTDQTLYRAECQSVFARYWHAVGRIEQVQQPGDYLTFQLANDPLVVVRSDDTRLRAFYNVCRHRGARLLASETGRVDRFRCPYHGWTYDLFGQLRGMPEFEGVCGFAREDHGLVELNVACEANYVWVHAGRQPPSLSEFLQPLPDLAKQLRLDRLYFVERRDYLLNCNWKIFVDNYLDGGYHINYVHPALADVIHYPQYRTELSHYVSIQKSPLTSSHSSGETARLRPGRDAYYIWVFPNFMLNVYETLMDTNLVIPLGPDRCRVVFDFFFADPEDREFIEQSIALADRIQQEDIWISEEVQRGVASRAYAFGRYSVRRETAVFQFHRLLAQALRSHREPDPA